MREITIRNPVAGGGKAAVMQDQNLPKQVRFTSAAGDCRKIVAEECLGDPHTHFEICGGDGTINEAVCGIMDARAGATAAITVTPTGSGNDTVKSLPDLPKGTILPLDLIRVNDTYSINMINIGFDCNVVASAARFKRIRLFKRTLSYILGIVTEFFKPFGEEFAIEALCEDGSVYTYEGSCLLCAICNGEWCGGGFHNSPSSDMNDGILEMLLVKKTSRLNFIRLIGKYKDGTLIDPVSGLPPRGYEDIVIYRRIRRITVRGTRRICTDGEVLSAASAEISVLPHAIRYCL